MPSKKSEIPQNREEIFEMYTRDQGLLTGIYKEHLQLDETVSMNLSIHPSREDIQTSSEHMKRYSKSLVFGEMQITSK